MGTIWLNGQDSGFVGSIDIPQPIVNVHIPPPPVTPIEQAYKDSCEREEAEAAAAAAAQYREQMDAFLHGENLRRQATGLPPLTEEDYLRDRAAAERAALGVQLRQERQQAAENRKPWLLGCGGILFVLFVLPMMVGAIEWLLNSALWWVPVGLVAVPIAVWLIRRIVRLVMWAFDAVRRGIFNVLTALSTPFADKEVKAERRAAKTAAGRAPANNPPAWDLDDPDIQVVNWKV